MINVRGYIHHILLLCLLLCGAACQSEQKEPQSMGEPIFKLEQNNTSAQKQIALLSEQLKSSPNNYALYEDRSRLYYQLDKMDSAVMDIDAALKLYREGPDLHYLKGFYAYVQDDTLTARKEFESSIGLGTANPESYYQLGQIYFFQRKYELADQNYQEAIKLDSREPTYVLALGLLYQSQRKFAQAESAYLATIEIDSTFLKGLSQLHDLYLNNYRNEDKAMNYNQQLLDIDPGHALGRFREGNFYLRKALSITDEAKMPEFQEAINQAVVAFTIAINRDETFLSAIYSRAYCYFLADDYDSAIRDFERILQLDHTHAQANFMLGSIYEHYQDYATALSFYEKVLEGAPGQADAQRAIQELNSKLN